MSRIGVYLAGGMKSDWQDEVLFICDMARPGRFAWRDPRKWQDQYPKAEEYVRQDLRSIRDCSILFAWMAGDNPSGYGLSAEMGYANALGRKIIFANEMKHDWRDKYFDFHRELADEVYTTLVTGARGLIAMADRL